MSNTINIGGIEVSKFYLGGSSDVKIYLGTTKLYPHLQEPCFAVVNNISTYTARTYVDVYETSSDKWYKLNNLNQYEEYGIYGSGRTITTYEGKLTIDDGYEYLYSGSSWVNVGEVSGSSRVPAGYTEIEYVENSTLAYINTGFKPNQDTRIVAEMQVVTSTSYNPHFGCGAWNAYNCIRMGYETGINGTLHVKYGTKNGWTVYSSVRGDLNKHTYDWNKNEFYMDGSLVGSVTYGNFQATDNLGIFYAIEGSSAPSSTYISYARAYSFKIYDNDVLARDLVPCKRDSDSRVGMYDIANDAFYYPPNYTSYQLLAGPTVTGGTVYPMYYDEKSDPPNNLSFSSMTEAEAYECPWVGMHATIAGSAYTFTSGYTWEVITLPYTELQWIEMPQTSPYCAVQLASTYSNSTSLYYDFEILFNSLADTRIIGFARNSFLIGYNNNSIYLNINGGRAFTVNSKFTTNTKYHFGLGKRNSSSNNTFDNLDASTTYATFGTSLPKTNKPYFGAIDNGSLLVNGHSEIIYSIKVYDNEVLVGNYIPVKRNSDNFVTLYDTVSEQFCDTVGGGTMVAGPTV